MRRSHSFAVAVALVLSAAVSLPCWAARAVVQWEYDYVNVRVEASPTADPVGRLAAGAEADILEQNGAWARVRYSGGEGWVVSRSLQVITPAGAEEPPAQGGDAPPPPTPSPAAPAAPPLLAPPNEAPASAPQPPTTGYLSQYTDDLEMPVFDTGPSVLSVLSGLFIVLALIAATVFVVRKLLGSRFPVGRRPTGIRILASRPVAPRQSLLLVEVEGLVWLVGQGPEGMQLIAPIEDPRALEQLDDRYEFLETPFQSELRRNFELEGEGPPSSGAAPAVPAEPTREQRLAALRRRGKPGDDA